MLFRSLASKMDMVGLEQGAEVTELEGLEESPEGLNSENGFYEEMGTVYRDPDTGKLYMVTK